MTLSAGVDARPDGSGTVRAAVGFDDEALADIGNPATELRLDDLRQAGWRVAEPRKEKDGLTWIRAAKGFATPEEASRVAAELSGPEGPFRELRLEHSRSLLRNKTSFTGLLDLSNGLAGLSDPGLQAKLGDADLALDLEGLRRRFGPAVDHAVRVRMEARLPGRHQTWEPKMGEQVRLDVGSVAWNWQPIVGAAAAAVAALAALAVGNSGRRSASRG